MNTQTTNENDMRENIIIIPDFENIGSVGPAKHKINLVSPNVICIRDEIASNIFVLPVRLYIHHVLWETGQHILLYNTTFAARFIILRPCPYNEFIVQLQQLIYNVRSTNVGLELVKMYFKVFTLGFLFIIRLRFPPSKSVASIIRVRYVEVTLKDIRKLEKSDLKKRKLLLDVNFLETCRDANIIPRFLHFRASNSVIQF